MYDLLQEKDVGKNDVNGKWVNRTLYSNSMLLDKMYSTDTFSAMNQEKHTMQREDCKEGTSKFEFADVSKRHSTTAHIRQVSVVQREVGDIPWVIWILLLLVGEELVLESLADIIRNKPEDEAEKDIDSLAADNERVKAIVQPRKGTKPPKGTKPLKGKKKKAIPDVDAGTSVPYVSTPLKSRSAFGSQAGGKSEVVFMPTQTVTQEQLDSSPVIKVGVGNAPPQAVIPHHLTSIWHNDGSKGTDTIDYHYKKHNHGESLIDYLQNADNLRGVVSGINVSKKELDATRVDGARPVKRSGFIIRSYIVGDMMRTKYSNLNLPEFIIVCGGQIVSYGFGDGRNEWA